MSAKKFHVLWRPIIWGLMHRRFASRQSSFFKYLLFLVCELCPYRKYRQIRVHSGEDYQSSDIKVESKLNNDNP